MQSKGKRLYMKAKYSSAIYQMIFELYDVFTERFFCTVTEKLHFFFGSATGRLTRKLCTQK